jgi:AcrR family transcriptional regulator
MTVDTGTYDVVLDAAETCFDRMGFTKPTMEGVAGVAGVSRGYLYKHFRNRDGLILAVLVRRAELFNKKAKSFIAAQPTFADQLVEGIMFGVKMAYRDPYFGRLVGAATADPEHRIPGALAAAEDKISELWRPVLENARVHGLLAAELEIIDVIDWIRIVLLGLLANKNSFDTADHLLERQLRTLLVPAVVRPAAP